MSSEPLSPTQNLEAARAAMLSLPGAESYVSNPQASPAEIDAGLNNLAEDLTLQLEAKSMQPFITDKMGWSETQALQFFSLPEHQPFQSHLSLAPPGPERRRQLSIVGQYLSARYQHAKEYSDPDSDTAQKTGTTLKVFAEYAIYDLFGRLDYELNDSYQGIVTSQRKAGTITTPSLEVTKLIEQAVAEVATSEEDTKALSADVMRATNQGFLTPMYDILFGYQYPKPVRRVCQLVIEKRVSDPTLTRDRLKLTWQTHSFLLSLGLNQETLLELNGFVDATTAKEKIMAFLTDKALTTEFESHLKHEAPEAAKNLGTDQPVRLEDVLDGVVQSGHFPPQIETQEELATKLNHGLSAIHRAMPLTSLTTPLIHVEAPTRLGASHRGWNIPYTNKFRQKVSVTVINPYDDPELMFTLTGHEIGGHNLQVILVKLGEKFGIPENSLEKIPSHIAEEIARLIEAQIAALAPTSTLHPETKINEKGENIWPNLIMAFYRRRQGPWGLIQLTVREKFEALWHQGKHDTPLTDAEANDIIATLDPQITTWFAMGINLHAPLLKLYNHLNPLDALDGLAYLSKILAKAKDDQKPQADIVKAFTDRFTPSWINDPNARLVYYGLIIKTATEHDLDKLEAYIATAEPEAIKTQLIRWGIDKRFL